MPSMCHWMALDKPNVYLAQYLGWDEFLLFPTHFFQSTLYNSQIIGIRARNFGILAYHHSNWVWLNPGNQARPIVINPDFYERWNQAWLPSLAQSSTQLSHVRGNFLCIFRIYDLRLIAGRLLIFPILKEK